MPAPDCNAACIKAILDAMRAAQAAAARLADVAHITGADPARLAKLTPAQVDQISDAARNFGKAAAGLCSELGFPAAG
jgi:hypothetical protein